MTCCSLTIRITLTLLFVSLLALLSLVPGHHKPGDSAFIWLVAHTPTLAQKLMHVFLYGMLTLMLVWTFAGIESRTWRLLVSMVIATAFGAAMEWCQTMVPGRYASAYDIALNAAGSALGLVAAGFML